MNKKTPTQQKYSLTIWPTFILLFKML